MDYKQIKKENNHYLITSDSCYFISVKGLSQLSGITTKVITNRTKNGSLVMVKTGKTEVQAFAANLAVKVIIFSALENNPESIKLVKELATNGLNYFTEYRLSKGDEEDFHLRTSDGETGVSIDCFSHLSGVSRDLLTQVLKPNDANIWLKGSPFSDNPKTRVIKSESCVELLMFRTLEKPSSVARKSLETLATIGISSYILSHFDELRTLDYTPMNELVETWKN